MNPSSAIALVSARPGAATPAFLLACSALEMASPFFSQPMSKVVAMAQANAVLIKVRLVVLIVPFFVDCRPNDTVSVFAHPAAIISTMSIWDLVVYRTLGQ